MELAKRVLVVDDFASDRKLISHWLTKAGLDVTSASDIRSAIVQVQEQAFDLLLIDYRLRQEKGTSLIRELRKQQITIPIIAISADESEAIKSEVIDAGASMFLKKPIDPKLLEASAYKLIGVDESSDKTPIYSKHKDDTEMRPLITEFTRGLTEYIEELRDANAQGDYELLEYISHKLKGSGDGYGFPMISEHAGELLNALNREMADIEDIRQQANELIAVLNRVKLK